MNTADRLYDQAAGVLNVARRFHTAAGEPDAHLAAPESLDALEEALTALSGAWYQLAADSSRQGDALSREQQVVLLGTMHDVAAALARAARVCRDARTRVTPLVDPRLASAA
jgi:hypothetical protein